MNLKNFYNSKLTEIKIFFIASKDNKHINRYLHNSAERERIPQTTSRIPHTNDNNKGKIKVLDTQLKLYKSRVILKAKSLQRSVQ